MVQRDYILRMIEQLGVAWAALLRIGGLRGGRDYAEAGDLLDQTLRRSLGLGAGALDTLSAEELIGLVRLGRPVVSGDEVVAEKLLLLGALALERADLLAAQGAPGHGAELARTALQIFLTVLLEERPDAERAIAALDPLLARLADHELPPSLKEQLWRYHERIGAFGSAEDWLFALLDDDPAALAGGIAFYERLDRQPDDALARGNLPRDEVAAGLAELRARAG